MNRLTAYATAVVTSCAPVPAFARPPATRAVPVWLDDGPRMTWTRCAIAAYLTAAAAQRAVCTNAEQTTTCLLPSGDAWFVSQWRGDHAGLYLASPAVPGPTLIGRLRQVTVVRAEMVRGLDPATPHDVCQLELGQDDILRVVWSAGVAHAR